MFQIIIKHKSFMFNQNLILQRFDAFGFILTQLSISLLSYVFTVKI